MKFYDTLNELSKLSQEHGVEIRILINPKCEHTHLMLMMDNTAREKEYSLEFGDLSEKYSIHAHYTHHMRLLEITKRFIGFVKGKKA